MESDDVGQCNLSARRFCDATFTLCTRIRECVRDVNGVILTSLRRVVGTALEESCLRYVSPEVMGESRITLGTCGSQPTTIADTACTVQLCMQRDGRLGMKAIVA